jgi:hypothetical protein
MRIGRADGRLVVIDGDGVVDVATASGGESLGKSFPGFGLTGPWLVTPDGLGELRNALVAVTG